MGTDKQRTFELVSDSQPGNSEANEMEIDCSSDRIEHSNTPPTGEAVGLVDRQVAAAQVTGHNHRSRLVLLPIVTSVFLISSFFICYGIAVALGHVEPDFPYISHTGVDPPERCIFSQLVNMGALMMAANVFVKFLQMAAVLNLINASSIQKFINKASLIVGLLSAAALSVVANFQTKDMREVHYTGAFIAFYLGTVYCWLVTFLSFRHNKRMPETSLQITNSILLTCCLLIFTFSKNVYRHQYKAGLGTKHDNLRDVYLTSTSSEWLTAIFLVTFVLTFCRDFANIRLTFPSVTFRDEALVRKRYSNFRQTDTVV